MSKYQVIDNITVPVTARVRPRGELALAIDGLEIGQGFHFEAKGTLTSQYSKVSPSKFDGKKFKIWLVEAAEVEGGNNVFGVARIEPTADADEGEDEGQDNGANGSGDEA